MSDVIIKADGNIIIETDEKKNCDCAEYDCGCIDYDDYPDCNTGCGECGEYEDGGYGDIAPFSMTCSANAAAGTYLPGARTCVSRSGNTINVSINVPNRPFADATVRAVLQENIGSGSAVWTTRATTALGFVNFSNPYHRSFANRPRGRWRIIAEYRSSSNPPGAPTGVNAPIRMTQTVIFNQ